MTTVDHGYAVEDTSAAKLQATPEGVAAFVAARFGLSIHRGLYSLQGRGEWVYFVERIPLDVYRQRLGQFNPVRFDAEEWADLIHSLQPAAVVCNNTHILPLRGEDYQVWELDMPGENTVGFNTTAVGDKPKAVWWNLNTGWAYAPRAHLVKDPADIVGKLKEANRRGAGFSLNVGPRPWGDIHPEEALALRRIGQIRRRQG